MEECLDLTSTPPFHSNYILPHLRGGFIWDVYRDSSPTTCCWLKIAFFSKKGPICLQVSFWGIEKKQGAYHTLTAKHSPKNATSKFLKSWHVLAAGIPRKTRAFFSPLLTRYRTVDSEETNYNTLGIQSPNLRMVMEPKYLSFRRWLYTPCSSSNKVSQDP